ncbi:MAG: hypothetical protein JWQ90_4177 [Hydrocarboniphaga sp.]|nr:hypothetical protein [Hydrocarboniphaga sp.]
MAICTALVSLAFHEEDWRWVQKRCLYFLESDDEDISGLAATCLGHIARIHRQLDKDVVVHALRSKLSNAKIAGRIEDALDDIDTFI